VLFFLSFLLPFFTCFPYTTLFRSIWHLYTELRIFLTFCLFHLIYIVHYLSLQLNLPIWALLLFSTLFLGQPLVYKEYFCLTLCLTPFHFNFQLKCIESLNERFPPCLICSDRLKSVYNS